jgi:thermitase
MPIQSIRRTERPAEKGSNGPVALTAREQWPLKRLGLGHPESRKGQEVRDVLLAIVDSGVSEDEHSLGSRDARTVIRGQTRDDEEHGTLLAWTIRAATAAALGQVGTHKLRILPVKFSSAQYVPSADRAAKAIEHASEEMRPGVILLAWDVGYTTSNLKQALEGAASTGALVVAAAGNHSLDNDRYPNWPANYGCMDHVITVMATDEDDERASFSNYGKKTVHVAAPGFAAFGPEFRQARRSVQSAGYRYLRGTSASAAYVAALAALIRAKQPSLKPHQVKARLCESVTSVPALTRFCQTGGRIEYPKAL